MKGIADTGFIVAFGNRNVRHRDWAVEVAKNVAKPLLICEVVLAEASLHLRSSSYVPSLVEGNLLAVAFDFTQHTSQLLPLAKRYEDREPDLADLCVIRMSELYRDHVVVTVDEKDFRIYRRGRRESIPLLCPSGSPR